MTKNQFSYIEDSAITLTFDKVLDEDFASEEKDILEGTISVTSGELFSGREAEIKSFLEASGFEQSEKGIVFKKIAATPMYHEGEIVIFGTTSMHFCLTHMSLQGVIDAADFPEEANAKLKISAGWVLLKRPDFENVLTNNKDILKAHLFQFLCKQVRKRGGVRDIYGKVEGLSINPDTLYQSLLGIPVNSLSKRVYTYLSEPATAYRVALSKAYKKALNSLIEEELITKTESSEGINQYIPITMEELKKKSQSFQKQFSLEYGTESIS
ncbi:hypothetical protein [Vibrio sp. D431a]|uniref:hypothetical protein n=1 Tax=Vibrio sp. D431a TaxID=2837388 RepID=UPI002557BC2C|nr:hypothetical protein [Vibrio sp. D431a]MDK9793281.1 hypothetical protein [Vibrio sp. D431a]